MIVVLFCVLTQIWAMVYIWNNCDRHALIIPMLNLFVMWYLINWG